MAELLGQFVLLYIEQLTCFMGVFDSLITHFRLKLRIPTPLRVPIYEGSLLSLGKMRLNFGQLDAQL